MLASKDITAASRGDEDLTKRSSILHGGDLVAGDSGLESVDGINFGNEDSGTHGVESLGATLSNVTETSDDSDLTSDHDIGGTLDTIDEGFSASVQVVELGLGDSVIDVDGRDKELALLHHPVEVVNTSGGLLRDTEAVLEHVGVLLVDQRGQITTVIEDQVQLLAVLECLELLLKAPGVLLLGLTLPGEAKFLSATITHSQNVKRKAYTGVPAAAMAAAAWSWVEKMLQLDQVTSAPREVKVSIRTAVWMAKQRENC